MFLPASTALLVRPETVFSCPATQNFRVSYFHLWTSTCHYLCLKLLSYLIFHPLVFWAILYTLFRTQLQCDFFFFFVFQPKFHFIKANLNLCLSNTLTKTYPLVEIEYNFCNPWAWLFFILYRKYRTIWRPSNFLFSYTPSALELYVFFIMSFV